VLLNLFPPSLPQSVSLEQLGISVLVNGNEGNLESKKKLDHYFNYKALIIVAQSVDNAATVQLMCQYNKHDN